ncbi:MAG: DUF421 domain-containing protein [Clostridia bacterium]|nr:DUF421 domain-containing protein [Clostridia bacterium]
MISVVIRTAILYIIVTVGIRLMGKRQIGDMQPNELVVTLLISEIAAIPLQDMDQPVFIGVVAIFTLVIIEIIISILSMRSYFFRKIVNGKSVVLIKNGMIDQKAMKNVRMTVFDLVELLRSQEVFDISSVAYAVLEVNGSLSVLLKGKAKPVTPSDLNLGAEDKGLPLPVISDGKVIDESLDFLQISRNNLEGILKKERLTIKDVFLMMVDKKGNKNIVKKV